MAARLDRRTPIRFLVLAVAWSAAVAASFGEWPQWRGPGRDGRAAGPVEVASWPEALELVWRVPVGPGHASPLVAGGQVHLFVREGEGDRVETRRLADGSLVWSNAYRSPYEPDRSAAEHGRGPFSTPLLAAVAGEPLLFTYGIDQVLTAWRATDGGRVWQRDFGEEFSHPYPVYGNSQSPILAQGALVVHAGGPGGGAIYGFDPADGTVRWRLPGDGAAYGSFVEAAIAGRRQLVGFTEKRLVGLDPAVGQILWQVDYPVPYANTVVTPTVLDDRVIVAAWQTPLRAYRVERSESGAWSAAVEWENRDIAIQHASPVLVAGRLYGHSHRNRGQLYAVEVKTGRAVWMGPPRQEDEQAVLVAAEPWILVFRQDGRLEVLDARDDEYRPRVTYRVAQSEVWAHPAVWGDKILVRDRGHLALWRIPSPATAAEPRR